MGRGQLVAKGTSRHCAHLRVAAAAGGLLALAAQLFLPWNVLFMASGAVFWWFLTPPMPAIAALDPWALGLIVARNVVTVALF